MPTYQLLIHDAAPPTTEGRAKLRERLVANLGMREELVEQLLSRLPCVLKTNLQLAEAQRLERLLSQLGARTEIQSEAPPAPPKSQDNDTPQTALFSFAAEDTAAPPPPPEQSPAEDAATEQAALHEHAPAPEENQPLAAINPVPSRHEPPPRAHTPPAEHPAPAWTFGGQEDAPLLEDPQQRRRKMIFGSAALAALLGLFYMLSGSSESTPPPAEEVQKMLERHEHILPAKIALDAVDKAGPPLTFSGELKDGPFTSRITLRRTGTELAQVQIEIKGEQIEKRTDADVIAGITKPWIEQVACETFRSTAPVLSLHPPPGSIVSLADDRQSVSLTGQGRTYIVDGTQRRRQLTEITVTLDPRTSKEQITGSWKLLHGGAQLPEGQAVFIQRAPSGSFQIAATGKFSAALAAQPEPTAIEKKTKMPLRKLKGASKKKAQAKKKTKSSAKKAKKGGAKDTGTAQQMKGVLDD